MNGLLLTIIVAICSNGFAQNAELLSNEEQRILRSLETIQWSQSISEEHIKLVSNSLKSSKEVIVETSLCAAIVHGLPELKTLLQQGVGPANGFARILAEIVLRELARRGESPIATLRGARFEEASSRDIPLELRRKASRIVAVFMARELRSKRGLSADWKELELNSFNEKLLRYSELPSERAIDEIISDVRSATVASSAMFDLVRILCTYQDKVGLDVILDALESKEETTSYGKILFLWYVRYLIPGMNNKDRQKVRNVLSELEGAKDGINRAVQYTREVLCYGREAN